jgi:aspartyl-tRNA(Asn)/glutamyl-tRNA(Gln) amidotransferase subunit A
VISEDVLFTPLRELGALVKARRVTPVELAEVSLHRLERIGPKLGAVVTVTRELALAEAHRANQEILAGKYRGPLHGIPYGAKDLLATKGIPTTWGAEPYRSQVFDHDATVIIRLREAGALLCAKLAMVELAGGLGYNNPDASFTGPGRTPWNTDYWSGGSSSGSGAAVAAGLVSFAIGSETSGSILTPATFCGLTGLRPTYGLVSRHGAMALCWTLDKLGPMGRSADDCGLVLAAMAGPDSLDPTTAGEFSYPRRGSEEGGAGRRFRLGVLKGATRGAEPEVAANFQRSLAELRAFASVELDVPFPEFPYGPAVDVIVGAEGAAAFRDLIESGRTSLLRDKADRAGGPAMLMTLAVDYLQAMRLRVPMRAAYDDLLSRYDALVAPTLGEGAPRIGQDFTPAPPEGAPPSAPKPDEPRAPDVIPAGNLVGAPALCLPNGMGAHGIPTSIQFLGRAFSEGTLLALADRYQGLTDWHTRRAPAVAV